jgi:integrase
LAKKHCSEEFALALEVGFFSGLRIGSIISLHDGTLSAATPSPTFEKHWEIPVGPHHGVSTKNDVNYWAVVPDFTMRKLTNYAEGERRRYRRNLQTEKSSQIFLNKFGRPLTTTSWQEQMTNLRNAAALEQLDLRHFYFHCTRATFGTILLGHMLSNPTVPTQQALKTLKRVMGHAKESTSLTYVKWLDEHDALATLIDDYGQSLMATPQ